jgi:hypothetical protein
MVETFHRATPPPWPERREFPDRCEKSEARLQAFGTGPNAPPTHHLAPSGAFDRRNCGSGRLGASSKTVKFLYGFWPRPSLSGSGSAHHGGNKRLNDSTVSPTRSVRRGLVSTQNHPWPAHIRVVESLLWLNPIACPISCATTLGRVIGYSPRPLIPINAFWLFGQRAANDMNSPSDSARMRSPGK